MKIKNKLKKKKRMKSRRGVIYLTLIIFLNIVGIGYGIWENGIVVETTISTGNMNAIFSCYKIIHQEHAEDSKRLTFTDVDISDKGDKLDVIIQDAEPGYSATIAYTIENRGSIPVKCKINGGNPGPVKITVEEPMDIIEALGGSWQGTIHIEIDDVVENENYRATVNLTFEQYNMSEW